MALAHMRKMDEAHRKLQMAENVMANLQRVVSRARLPLPHVACCVVPLQFCVPRCPGDSSVG